MTSRATPTAGSAAGYEYVARRPLAVVGVAESRGLDHEVVRSIADRLANSLDVCATQLASEGRLVPSAARIAAHIDRAGAPTSLALTLTPGPGPTANALVCFVSPFKLLHFPAADVDPAARGAGGRGRLGWLHHRRAVRARAPLSPCGASSMTSKKPPPPPTVSRSLRQDGTYNIERRGMPRRRFTQDVYHHLLNLEWRWLIPYIAGVYTATNAFFALLYLGFGDAILNARRGSFQDAFFFSVQTMATIGYGTMVPSGFAGNVLVTVESLLGMVMVAVLTGLLFAKFSRPTSRVVFSKVAVITKHDGVPTLVFRVANERDSIIVEARIRVIVMRMEKTAEGATTRRFHDLVLLRNENPIFPLSWAIFHPIDAKSPLHGATSESLVGQDLEIICALAGTEESLEQTIRARYSYTLEDLRFDHHFVDIVSIGEGGKRILDYTHFHDVVAD